MDNGKWIIKIAVETIFPFSIINYPLKLLPLWGTKVTINLIYETGKA